MKTIKHYCNLFLLLPLFITNASAQKLPVTQQASLRAPANIKIDGLTPEWSNGYQAYNKSTGLFYSIANDDDNLYLTIHAVNPRIMYKIMQGGISFTVSNSGKKTDKKNISVLFPLLTSSAATVILHTAGKTITESQIRGLPVDKDVALADKQQSIAGANKKLKEGLKEIKIFGIKSITDTITGINPKSAYYKQLPMHLQYGQFIPVDNNGNIKAMMQFDSKEELNYELAIPIKHLNLSINNPQKFIYNIKIHGRNEDNKDQGTVYFNSRGQRLNQDLEAPTDFWAEYVLVK